MCIQFLAMGGEQLLRDSLSLSFSLILSLPEEASHLASFREIDFLLKNRNLSKVKQSPSLIELTTQSINALHPCRPNDRNRSGTAQPSGCLHVFALLLSVLYIHRSIRS